MQNLRSLAQKMAELWQFVRKRTSVLLLKLSHFELQLKFGLYHHLEINILLIINVLFRTQTSNSAIFRARDLKFSPKILEKILEKKNSRKKNLENFQKKILESFRKLKKTKNAKMQKNAKNTKKRKKRKFQREKNLEKTGV